jgi:uncharacterized protein (DUF2249 family)
MQLKPRTLDVHEILRAGGEPVAEIMHAIDALLPGQALRLLAAFQPAPLFSVMADWGYAHTAHERKDGNWEVLFVPASTAAELPASRNVAAA